MWGTNVIPLVPHVDVDVHRKFRADNTVVPLYLLIQYQQFQYL
jgi:hypothetical protein